MLNSVNSRLLMCLFFLVERCKFVYRTANFTRSLSIMLLIQIHQRFWPNRETNWSLFFCQNIFCNFLFSSQSNVLIRFNGLFCQYLVQIFSTNCKCYYQVGMMPIDLLMKQHYCDNIFPLSWTEDETKKNKYFRVLQHLKDTHGS